MADFFDAVLGLHTNPEVKLAGHGVDAALLDFATQDVNAITEAQFLTKVQGVFTAAGETLSAGGETEISELFTDVNDAGNLGARITRAITWQALFNLGENGYKYDTVAAVKTRMGL